MKKILSLVSVAALAAAVSLASAAPSAAAPLHRHYGPGPGVGIAAGVLGFMAGAMAANAASNSYYEPRYYGPRFVGPGPGWSDHEAACFDAYRSYDPDSDTYLGFDGYRHYCNL